MRAWQTPLREYYLANRRRAPVDTHAPARPSADHVWVDGVGWVVPPDIADRKAAAEVDTFDRLLFEVNWNQENRLRALEGKLPVSRVQYRDALIAVWKQLNA